MSIQQGDMTPELEEHCFALCRQSSNEDDRYYKYQKLFQDTLKKLLESTGSMQLLEGSAEGLRQAKMVATKLFRDKMVSENINEISSELEMHCLLKCRQDGAKDERYFKYQD